MNSPVALVTGAARGIGAAIATELASNGMDVAIMDVLEPDETVRAVEETGQKALGIVADVSNREDREKAIEQLDETFGRLDVLVNNAGVAPKVRADMLEAGEESYDRVMGINLKGPYFLTQQVANWMIRRRETCDDWMCVVNIGSMSSYTASPSRGEYCLSKAGVSMATKLWATRLADYGIGVYEIRPGIIATEMTSKVKDKYDKLIGDGLTPIRRWGQPGDVAGAVAVCARGELKFSTGEIINVDGGFHLQRL
ncbi:MAG: 3-ketoacyl-ACP reductase [Phycisphaerae bacterium]